MTTVCKKCGWLRPPGMDHMCTADETVSETPKHDQGKPRPSLIPWAGLAAVMEVAEFGAAKYSPHGWKTVANGQERYREALLRHALAFAGDPEATDAETGFLHLAHLTWNGLVLLALRAMGSK